MSAEEIRMEPNSTLAKDFSNALACGTLPLTEKRSGCGSRNWRVFTPPWAHDERTAGGFSEFELRCQGCGQATLVLVKWDGGK